MYRIVPILIGLLCLVSICLAEDEHAPEAQEAPSEKTDAVLLLDSSGSMLLSDPSRLRDEGAKQFIQFLNSDDRLAIVSFSEEPNIVMPLTDYNQGLLPDISNRLAAINNDGIYTDLQKALQSAMELLQENGRPDANKIIILFSDGKMDPNPVRGSGEGLTTQLFNQELPLIKSKGFKVYTLSFSEHADKELLAQIAASTDGVHWFASTPEQIQDSFGKLFLVVKKPQVVPLTKKGFSIDAGVEEATFYINREGVTQEIEIESPSGIKIIQTSATDNIKWYRGSKFDIITITPPEVGDWRVSGLASSESFATVLTKLKLVTSWPNEAITAGETVNLEARFFEGDKPIVLPQMTGSIAYGFQVTPTDRVSEPILKGQMVDDGTAGDKKEWDGIFTTTVTIEEEGEYRLTVAAKGPTFLRQQQLLFRIRPRLATLSLEQVEERRSEGNIEDETGEKVLRDYFRIKLSEDALGLKKREIKLVAIDSDKKRIKLPVRPSVVGEGYFDSPTSLLPHDGEYTVVALLFGEGRRGKRYDISSNRLEYNREKPGARHHEEEEMVVKEVVKKKVSPVPYFILILLLNSAGGFLALKKVQGMLKGQVSVVVREYSDPPEFVKGLAAIEEKLKLVDVDLDDPVFGNSVAEGQAKPATPESVEKSAAEPTASPESAAQQPESSSEGEAVAASESPEAQTPEATQEEPKAEETEQ